MNLKTLEYFVEVAKDLNMSTAAQRLYISQQALSSQIRRLEDYYGVALFERQPKLQLTYAGQQLLEDARKVIQDCEAITNNLSEISKKHIGIMRIGIPTFRAKECFPLVLSKFTRKWPNVKINLDESSTDNVLEMVCDGGLDVGIVTPSPAEIQALSDRLEFTFLLYDRTYLICSDELLKQCFGDRYTEVKQRAALGTDLKEFENLPFMLHTPAMRLRKVADECFSGAGFKPNVFIETGNTDLMIALYPCNVGGFLCRQTRLRSIRQMYSDCNAFPVIYANEPHQSAVYFVRRKGQRTPAYILYFQQLMQEAWKTIAEF